VNQSINHLIGPELILDRKLIWQVSRRQSCRGQAEPQPKRQQTAQVAEAPATEASAPEAPRFRIGLPAQIAQLLRC